ADGRYAVSVPQPRSQESVVVAASAAGFARSEQRVAAAAPAATATSASASIDFQLQPAAIIEQVTVVSGSRQAELRGRLNMQVDVVTQETIQNSGADTVGELLRELPGVVTRRGSEGTGAAGEQIQGIDSRQVLVLMDGQPLVGARGIKRGAI